MNPGRTKVVSVKMDEVRRAPEQSARTLVISSRAPKTRIIFVPCACWMFDLISPSVIYTALAVSNT